MPFLAGSIEEPTFNAKVVDLRDDLANLQEFLAKVANVAHPNGGRRHLR